MGIRGPIAKKINNFASFRFSVTQWEARSSDGASRAKERAEQLREHAKILCGLATSFDIQTIPDQLLNLATRAEEMATTVEKQHDARPKAMLQAAA
jgi:predicted TIM-barrel fold metal-dependent hydrolase